MAKRNVWRGVRAAATWVAALVVLLVVVAWLSGWFEAKVPPGETEPPRRATLPGDVDVIEVAAAPAPDWVKAVGSVQAVQEITVASRVQAQVQRVAVKPGQSVERGALLVELDPQEVEARLRQAEANVSAAMTRLEQAGSDLEKLTQLREQGAATEREFLDAQRVVRIAEAELERSREAVREAQTQLDYTRVVAPIAGTVIDTYVESGDMAQPNQRLVTLYDELQMVASVPERIAVGLERGDKVGVEIDAIGLRCEAEISEIVPQAQTRSRSFIVKAIGPCPPGVYSGMFGRMLLPQGERTRVLVPVDAVRSVGQLDAVLVVDPADPQRVEQRLVRTGERQDGRIEILAGLRPGERIAAAFPGEM